MGKLEPGHEIEKLQGISLGLLQAIKPSPDPSFTIPESEGADAVHMPESHIQKRLVMIGRRILNFSHENGEAIPQE
jgi:hypothetical protein